MGVGVKILELLFRVYFIIKKACLFLFLLLMIYLLSLLGHDIFMTFLIFLFFRLHLHFKIYYKYSIMKIVKLGDLKKL